MDREEDWLCPNSCTAEAETFVKQAKASGSISSVEGAADEYAAWKQARADWIEQEKAADAAFVQEMLTSQQPPASTFDPAKWKQQDYAESARWEQQAYARFRQQKRAGYVVSSTQEKPWWQQPIGYGTILGGVVGGVVGGLLGGLPGLIGGAAVGATIGALWGSSQEGYIQTTRHLLTQTSWSSYRPGDFPSSPAGATDWLMRTMQSNANGPIGQTLRQVNDQYGPLGRLVTVPVWIKLVEGNGPWDFKVEQRTIWKWKDMTESMELGGLRVRRDTLANIHYGYVGRSLGYSRWFLEIGAGMAQIKAGTWKWEYWRTWFDDPVDNAAIRAGMDLYDGYTAQGQEINVQALQEVLQSHPDVLCTPKCVDK